MPRRFDELRRQIDRDPSRRRRVDDEKRLMRVVLALGDIRRRAGMTQEELAELLDVTQENVSRIEHQDDLYLSTLRGYVEALGGRLVLRAVFDSETVEIDIASHRAR